MPSTRAIVTGLILAFIAIAIANNVAVIRSLVAAR